MENSSALLEQMFGQPVVVDLQSPYVCLGTLAGADEHFLELRNADVHDLRDTETSRENYVAASVATGVMQSQARARAAGRDRGHITA